MLWPRDPAAQPFIWRRYMPRLALCSLAWEIAQLPLYTLWAEAHPGRIVSAVLHCTAGDLLIGMTSLVLAMLACRADRNLGKPDSQVLLAAILFAVLYTVPSERYNMAMGNWAYSPWMPMVPGLKIGLSPLVQWLVVPYIAWKWAKSSRVRQNS